MTVGSGGAPPGFRFERKFVSVDLGARELDVLIRLHPALFREVHAERYVNNIYFDTPFLDNYHANVMGVANRLKCRIRWYGKLFGAIERPVLELKRKRGLVGQKCGHPLAPFTLDTGFDAEAVVAGAGLAEDLELYLETLQPTLLNRYRRRYYLSADGDFRLTLDTGLEFHRIDARANRFGESVRFPERVILEVKYERGGERAAAITGAFPLRLSKSSKYVVGIDALYAW
jgi:hypothetical protein